MNDNRLSIRFGKDDSSWEEVKLNDIINVNSGRDYKALNKGDIPVYGTGGLMLFVDQAISNVDSIGIGRKGTINNPFFLKAPFWTVDTLFHVTPTSKVDIYFLLYLFQGINWEKYDESTGVPSLSKRTIEGVSVRIPNLDEQTKIGKFFKELDELIELQKNTVSYLKEVKKGFLQNMFPSGKEINPSIRYNVFSTDWYKINFSDVFTYRNGKAHERFIENAGEFIVVNSRFVSTDGVVKKHTNNPLEKIYEDEIVFVLSDVPKGKALSKAYLISENNKYTLNQRVAAFTPKDNLDPMFGYLIVNRNRYFLKFDNGVSQTNLSRADIDRFSAYISTKNEQIKIGDFFKQMDELIELEQQELESLQEMKKSFLQKIFV